MSSPTPFSWTEEDRKTVDTVRVLAMDAVQKVGNGHPGTAMSLAPVATLLFQKHLRHDPADAQWVGRDRFVLSPGHSSLTLYIQLYLSGYGLTMDDLKALRTWGSITPGHPEHRLEQATARHGVCALHNWITLPAARRFSTRQAAPVSCLTAVTRFACQAAGGSGASRPVRILARMSR